MGLQPWEQREGGRCDESHCGSFTISTKSTKSCQFHLSSARAESCKIVNPAPKIRKFPIGCSDPTRQISISRGRICKYTILLQTAIKVVKRPSKQSQRTKRADLVRHSHTQSQTERRTKRHDAPVDATDPCSPPPAHNGVENHEPTCKATPSAQTTTSFRPLVGQAPTMLTVESPARCSSPLTAESPARCSCP